MFHARAVPQIHPTAVVSPEACLGEDVVVGPFAVIDAKATIGARTRIGGHAWIAGGAEIGNDCEIGWGAVIGADPQDLSFDSKTESGVKIGDRNTLREYVTVHRGSKPGAYTRIGQRNFLMTGTHLAHDVVMGDDNVLANNVMLAGHVHVGNRVFLGGGSGFHQFIRVGDYAMAQGNSGFSQDLAPYCMGHGQNLLAGLNVVGMRRAGFDAETRAEIKAAAKLLLFSKIPINEALEEAAKRQWGAPARVLIDAVAGRSKKGVVVQ